MWICVYPRPGLLKPVLIPVENSVNRFPGYVKRTPIPVD